MKYFLLLVFFIGTSLAGCLFKQEEGQKTKETKDDIADPETTTPNGCKCTSLCGATLDDLFTKDWCYVEGECGMYTAVLGYWDYCLYLDSSKPDYVALDWKIKHDLLWQELKSDPTIGTYEPQMAFAESLLTTFENQWDVMPAGRVKAIHGVGGVCPFKIDISEESPFSGLLKPGKIQGFIRMGAAADFTSENLSAGFVPGVGIKFLRSGTSSANVLMLNSLIPLPDGNHNFFAVPLSNHIPEETADTPTYALTARFCQTRHCITKNGISNLATHDQDGNEAPELAFPFKLTLEIGDISLNEAKPSSLQEFVDQFKEIPAGSKLYSLKAHVDPDDQEGINLGDLITTDGCVSSSYGDKRLFFKHQWIEEDAMLKPEWYDSYVKDCGCTNA